MQIVSVHVLMSKVDTGAFSLRIIYQILLIAQFPESLTVIAEWREYH